jgi:N-acetylglutamate synthase-like GNAT family acetyltransferase
MAEEIIYRLALDSDINRINDFYNRIYKKRRTHEQFVWEYNSAPAGKAIYVIAEEGSAIVGTQCAIPYFVINKYNIEILTAKSEDTLVSPKHRGKHIFENMYKLLIEECKKKDIQFLWGFTYADKPFKKIGFEIPFNSTMGLLTISPFKATNYFYAITSKKNLSSYSKILALSLYSSIKYKLLFLKKHAEFKFDDNDVSYNTPNINYIKYDKLFGLKLDQDFLNYRIHRNPYSANYKTITYRDSEGLQASLVYNLTKENIG